MDRLGLSSVVATVLIVLITIVAGGIIAGIVIPFVKNNLNESTKCLSYENYAVFEDSLGYNCIQDNNALVSIKIKNDKENFNNVESIQVVFLGKINSYNFKIPSSNVLLLNGNNSKLPKPGETYTYNISLTEDFSKASLYIVLKSGKMCEMGDKISVARKC